MHIRKENFLFFSFLLFYKLFKIFNYLIVEKRNLLITSSQKIEFPLQEQNENPIIQEDIITKKKFRISKKITTNTIG